MARGSSSSSSSGTSSSSSSSRSSSSSSTGGGSQSSSSSRESWAETVLEDAHNYGTRSDIEEAEALVESVRSGK